MGINGKDRRYIIGAVKKGKTKVRGSHGNGPLGLFLNVKSEKVQNC